MKADSHGASSAEEDYKNTIKQIHMTCALNWKSFEVVWLFCEEQADI